ncbi:LysE family translocator [Glaciecola petra]|uniref:LysE family translocator n=1 Tax=Glaciecola petra TaxID=3075602 RepID=A0ABU2ZSF7_9ALTE|nr:LysE family translocator [Aestuariibacter sp. P117]MDT0595355.1 LysE family translocator [Aestuariibacter sp. P117]
MTTDLTLALMMFAFASSITPGPNNLMLMTSGVNYGFKQTLPHMFGVTFGFIFMAILVGLGITKLFEIFPITYTILTSLCVLYMFFLAYKIATSKEIGTAHNLSAKPMTFVQAVLFQWVNPKAWSMALTAISVYAPSNTIGAILLVACLFGAVNLPCITGWVVIGTKIKRLLQKPSHLRIFNATMAGLLVLSLYPLFFS